MHALTAPPVFFVPPEVFVPLEVFVLLHLYPPPHPSALPWLCQCLVHAGHGPVTRPPLAAAAAAAGNNGTAAAVTAAAVTAADVVTGAAAAVVVGWLVGAPELQPQALHSQVAPSTDVAPC